jgi:hypothetical protein
MGWLLRRFWRAELRQNRGKVALEALAGAVLGFRAGSCLGKGWKLWMFVVTVEVS